MLTPGQCLFVPAWWWVQGRTESEDTMITEMEFEIHSVYFNQINTGIEKELILIQENDLHGSTNRANKNMLNN